MKAITAMFKINGKAQQRAWMSFFFILCALTIAFFCFPITEAKAENTQSKTNEVGVLSVKLSNDADGYVDVETFTNQTTDWYIQDQRTLHIDYEFTESESNNKTIVVEVPTGYTIIGYSATDDTSSKKGVAKIEIDAQYKDSFVSSVLMGADNATAWESQKLTDQYMPQKSTTAVDVPTYGGVVTYTFNSETQKGTVVLTIKPQSNLLSHTAETEILDSIKVSMTSGSDSLERSFKANVTGIALGYTYTSSGIWGSYKGNVPYDSKSGQSGSFGVMATTVSYNTTTGMQPFYADQWSITINYPKGVSFDNQIFCRYLGTDIYTTSNATSGEEVVKGHLTVTVTGNANTGGKVIFDFKDTEFYHAGYGNMIGAYFTADRDVTESDALAFTVESAIETDEGKVYPYSFKSTRTLISNSGAYLIDVEPSNKYRRDMHATYADYPYDYAMGGFKLDAQLPYTNVPLSFDFTDLEGVRGLGVPGYNVRDVVAVTTNNRTIELESVPGKSSGFDSVPITPERLGLADGEHLKTLTCVVDLEQLLYHSNYTYGFTYYGHFVDGQEGDVVFSILDDEKNVAVNEDKLPLTVTDRTKIRWENSGGQDMYTFVYNEEWKKTTTFHPNEMIRFQSWIAGGQYWSDADTLTDPVIMISLPKGINLDTGSVTATSAYGNHPNKKVSLLQIGTPKKAVIDNVEWTTYYYTSAEPLDMIAMESYNSSVKNSTILVDFSAYVSATSSEYGQISLKDCVQWDLNTTINTMCSAKEIYDEDTYDRAGHGTEYLVHEYGDNFAVKPLIGLNVDLGIRVENSGTDFFVYDTTEDSIASLSKGKDAEVQISYENTADTCYFKNSAIYLPVPRVGNDYSKFFQNIEVANPMTTQTNKNFEFDAFLSGPVELDGWTTYYAVEAQLNGEAYNAQTNATSWEPVKATWMTESQLKANNYGWDDVIFMKLVANRDIDSGETGDTTFTLKISEQAQLEQVNYWRAYSRAVDQNQNTTDPDDDTGIWNYSSVIAATPVNFGVLGQFFIDADKDGQFDTADGDQAYTDGNVSAVLSRDGGGMDNLLLTVDHNGNFRSLNSNGSDYYLKVGSYTVTFTNADDTYIYSSKPGAQNSHEQVWYNDLEAANIEGNTATYHFEVTQNTTLGTYIGVALTTKSTSNTGVLGQFFIDSNQDGLFNDNSGDKAYTGNKVTATLSRDDGKIEDLILTVNADGSFRSLDANGAKYCLEAGNYTVTFTDNDETYVYSTTPGTNDSDASAWYNDIDSGNIAGTTATYRFTVTENSTLDTYIGIALKAESTGENTPTTPPEDDPDTPDQGDEPPATPEPDEQDTDDKTAAATPQTSDQVSVISIALLACLVACAVLTLWVTRLRQKRD